MKDNLNHQSNKENQQTVEILSIGTELLLGNILNTNSQWIADELSILGVNHYRQTTVGDNLDRICEVIQDCSLRCNLLITTGGLGPTPDDLTTQAIAKTFDVNLFEREYLWDEIVEKLSKKISNINNSSLKKQCFFPDNAQIINNPRGTAPGMIWEPRKGFTIMTFPGVPSELREMWDQTARKYITCKFSDANIFFSNTIKFSGIGESSLSESIDDLLKLKNPTVAPYANLGEVKLRITAKAQNEQEAQKIINPVKDQLKQKFPKQIFGEDLDTLASVIVRELKIRKQSIVFAESCTGGLLSSSITSIPGCSEVFKGSIIAYSNELKNSLLSVSKSLLDKYGAVSDEVAKAMAIGAKTNLRSTWSIAITGIAGPDGGTKEKPIGLIYFAIAGPKQSFTFKKKFNSIRNRNEIQRLSVNECLNSLRLILLSTKD